MISDNWSAAFNLQMHPFPRIAINICIINYWSYKSDRYFFDSQEMLLFDLDLEAFSL